MRQGERDANAPEVAAALTRVALELGGTWGIVIDATGQLHLRPLDDKASDEG